MGESGYTFSPIAILKTPFRERFGIPRQPGLADQALGKLVFSDIPHLADALKGLETFTHLWLIFVFHDLGANPGFKPTIRPPRLGGKKRVGVFATRSPHRPNPIGISVVKIESIEIVPFPLITVSGVDILDGTPILDIKPYLPYADSVPQAGAGWADEPLKVFPVVFSELAQRSVRAARGERAESTLRLMESILKWDPRPAHQKADFSGEYGIEIDFMDVRFRFDGESLSVYEIINQSKHR